MLGEILSNWPGLIGLLVIGFVASQAESWWTWWRTRRYLKRRDGTRP